MISCLRKSKFSPVFLAIFLSFLLIISCDDASNDLGLDILPASDKLPADYIDSVEVSLSPYTSPYYYANLNNPFIGIATDPVFGKLVASFASDLYFPEPFDTVTWGKRKILDSVKVSFYFDSVLYHNPNLANPLDHSFKLAIYPLTRPIVKDSNYTNATRPGAFVIGASIMTIQYFEYPVKNKVTFYLPASALSYFQKYLEFDSTQIRSDTLRHEKGLYGLLLYPIYNNNDIIYRLRTSDATTHIEFTYHLEGETVLYKLRGYFPSYYEDDKTSYGYNNGGLSLIEWDHSKAKIRTKLNGWSEDSLIYILGESPYRAKINFSKLNPLVKANHYIVIKADLYVGYDDYFYKTSINPTYTPRLKNIELKIALTPDSFASYSTLYGSPMYSGSIDTTSHSYIFDVTEFINKKLNGATTTDELFFYPTYRYSLQSAFLKNRLKLKIKYLKR